MWRMVAYCRTITDMQGYVRVRPDTSKLSMFRSVLHNCEGHDGHDISAMVAPH